MLRHMRLWLLGSVLLFVAGCVTPGPVAESDEIEPRSDLVGPLPEPAFEAPAPPTEPTPPERFRFAGFSIERPGPGSWEVGPAAQSPTAAEFSRRSDVTGQRLVFRIHHDMLDLPVATPGELQAHVDVRLFSDLTDAEVVLYETVPAFWGALPAVRYRVEIAMDGAAEFGRLIGVTMVHPDLPELALDASFQQTADGPVFDEALHAAGMRLLGSLALDELTPVVPEEPTEEAPAP